MCGYVKFAPPVYLGHQVTIKPTYIVSKPEYQYSGHRVSRRQLRNLIHLRDNSHKGKLSDKAKGRLRNSLNWLIESAQVKRVFSKAHNKSFNFKISFITLTIPRQQNREICNSTVKKMLHGWLMYSQKYFGLKNYVWKVENHKDGRLHLHLTTDAFIHHQKLRQSWNYQLIREGLLSEYKAKHGHENANSTDIHSVKNVQNLAAYLMKYMSKDVELSEQFKGRIWGCNYNLSETNTCKVFAERGFESDVLQVLVHKKIKYKRIQTEPDCDGKSLHLADLYIVDSDAWKNVVRGVIKEAYDQHRFEIRHNLWKPPPEYYTV